MEFSYRINEAQYAQAWRLRRNAGKRKKIVKVALFWVFILVCLVLLWGVIQHNAGAAPSVAEDAGNIPESHSFTSQLPMLLPIGAVLVAWVYTLFGVRHQLRKLYRNDPGMQGVFTVEITTEMFRTENTSGASGQTSWNIYDFWCEDAKNHLIVLVAKSQAYFVVSTVDLSEAERNQLRSILQTALRRK